MGLLDSWWNIILVALFALIVFLYDWVKNQLSYFQRNDIKHIKPNIKLFFKDLLQDRWPEGNVEWVYKEHTEDRYVGYYRGVLPSFVIRDPVLIDDLTGRSFEHFHDRWRHGPDHHNDPLYANLYFICGSKWQRLRDALSPGFSLDMVLSMFPAMQCSANSICQHIRRTFRSEDHVDAKELFSSYNLAILAQTCGIGLKTENLKNSESEIRKMLEKFTVPSSLKMTLLRLKLEVSFLWYIMRSTAKEVEQFFVDIFKKEIMKRGVASDAKNDFIQLLKEIKEKNLNDLEQHNESKLVASDELLSSQLVAFIQASMGSCSSLLALTCHHLAFNSHHQDKVRKEVRRTKQKFGVINHLALKEMKFLDLCIKETLRLNPLTPLLMRTCTKDYALDEDVTIKKGQTVCIPITYIQKDSLYWTNPNLYDPERFVRDQQVPGTYLPFGQGPRMCIGKDLALLQVKTLLAKLVENFEITSCARVGENLNSGSCLHQHSADGVQLRFNSLDLSTM